MTNAKTKAAATAETLPAKQGEANGLAVLPDFDKGLLGESEAPPSEEEAALLLVEDQGKGLEFMADDAFDPMLKLLQALSPEVQPGPDRVKDAQPGHIYCRDSGRLYGEAVAVVPCDYREGFVEWKPREKGGGYVGERPDISPEEYAELPFPDHAKTFRVLPDGNHLMDTSFYGVLAIDMATGQAEPAVIAMDKSQRRAARAWNRTIQRQRMTVDAKGARQEIAPPIWAYIYKLGARHVRNEKGGWFVWEVQGFAETPRQFIPRARKFAQSLRDGRARLEAREQSEPDAIQAPRLAAPRADVSAGLARLKETGDSE